MADDNNQKKYGDNRNLWRKLYPVGSPRRAPQQITVVDSKTGESFSLDLQTTVRHRDYFQIFNSQSFVSFTTSSVVVLGEYDEGTVTFKNSAISVPFNFNFTFSSTPVVVYTMESTTDPYTDNVNIFGSNIGTGGATVTLSAPFNGEIRYRAAYAASYPSYFTSSNVPSSGTFLASAGAVTPTNTTFYTASFGNLGSNPTLFYQTPFDPGGNTPVFDANVALSVNNASPTPGSVASEISAPTDIAINFIAVKP